jgi:hypothetical protein
MKKVHYEIIEHDGGWAYKLKDVFSEPFPTKEAALRAAERAAREQELPGEGQDIEFQDKAGRWHHEYASGRDRPKADVEEPGK